MKGFRIRGELLAGKNGHFPERLPAGIDVQDVLLAVGRYLEDLYGPGEDDVEAGAIVALGENRLAPSEALFQRDVLELGELQTVQTSEEWNTRDDVDRFHHAASFGSI